MSNSKDFSISYKVVMEYYISKYMINVISQNGSETLLISWILEKCIDYDDISYISCVDTDSKKLFK